jgi:hypothetical protein
MTSPFGLCTHTGPWTASSELEADGSIKTLTFDRYSAGFNTQFRETRLSWVASFSVTGNLQPAEFLRLFRRSEYGQLAETAFIFDVNGNPDIRVGDRTQVSATVVEVVNVDRYGTMHAECHLRWLR